MFTNMELTHPQHHTDLYMPPVPQLQCKIKLMNEDLWTSFHNLETEMIITKSGRRMFPSLRIEMSHLEPNEMYCVFVDMRPVTKSRYKYSASGGWAPAGAEEAQSPHKLYIHPMSPATGSQWMSQIISFSRLKLTNCANPPAGHLVLSSMHKYEPRIIVAKTFDPMNLRWSARTSIGFHQTQFIAVTAYQNEKITKLKIDNNPFAKGFRENGQSKCKRKRLSTSDDETPAPAVKKTRDENAENQVANNNADSDSDRTSSPESTIINMPASTPPSYNHYTYPQIPQIPMDFYSQYQHIYPYHHNMYHARPIIPYPIHPYYHRAYSLVAPILPQNLIVGKTETPRKLTDFSIKAITGLT